MGTDTERIFIQGIRYGKTNTRNLPAMLTSLNILSTLVIRTLIILTIIKYINFECIILV